MNCNEEEIGELIEELGRDIVGKHFDGAVYSLGYVIGTLLAHKPEAAAFLFKGVSVGMETVMKTVGEDDDIMGEHVGSA